MGAAADSVVRPNGHFRGGAGPAVRDARRLAKTQGMSPGKLPGDARKTLGLAVERCEAQIKRDGIAGADQPDGFVVDGR